MISVRNRFFVLSALALAAAIASYGELPPSVVRFGTDFARDVLAFDAEYAAATNRLPQKFMKDLADLSAAFQKNGDLDGLLAVKKEINRFKSLDRSNLDPFESVPDMTDEDIVSSPAELRALQEEYRRGFSLAKSDCKAKVKERGDKFLSEIEAEKTELTKAGKIEEAIAVRDAISSISGKVKRGEYMEVVRSLGLDLGFLKASASTVQKAGSVAASPSARASWSAWKYRSVYPFARELPRYVDPDVPNELTAYCDQSKGLCKVTGIRKSPATQIGDVFCSWLGKAFIWDVADIATLEADIRVKAKTFSAGADRGPFLEVAVLGNGSRISRFSVPIQCANDRVRIIRKGSNEFEFSWPLGKQTKSFSVPAGSRLNVLVGVVTHNPREVCDVSIQLENPAK